MRDAMLDDLRALARAATQAGSSVSARSAHPSYRYQAGTSDGWWHYGCAGKRVGSGDPVERQDPSSLPLDTYESR